MTDRAPQSSNAVRRALFRHVERGDLVERLEISTAVVLPPDGTYRAVTEVERPTWDRHRIGPAEMQLFDSGVAQAFKTLPGCNGSYRISMGRTYEVDWTGVTRPV